MRVTRLKDFPRLEVVKVANCILWTWEPLRLDNDFELSLLDLEDSMDNLSNKHNDLFHGFLNLVTFLILILVFIIFIYPRISLSKFLPNLRKDIMLKRFKMNAAAVNELEQLKYTWTEVRNGVYLLALSVRIIFPFLGHQQPTMLTLIIPRPLEDAKVEGFFIPSDPER